MNNVDFHEFHCFLLEAIKEKAPSAELLIVNGGDSVQDVVMEIRQGKNRLKYKPYELYCEGCINNNFEGVFWTFINDIPEYKELI